ncbi:hypothetical protein FKR81_37855 [Lentzea tibetensis]|uniref:Tissue inhibitor of metalloproteinase n=1 Tax=Lentzea tibetensis TaxID=2591470 RepID=A0A563EHP3_9PSEU|nr:hypothetical protein [Lentzea tibetensis]TWP45987.1 hypothetical protein FKR81_37855 [Lentzea tibetensis]
MTRAAHVLAAATLLAAALTAALTGTANACSCFPSTEAERFQRADHVFVAKIESKTVEPGDPSTPYDDKNRFTAKVRKQHKGSVPHRVDVVTLVQGSLCGLHLNVGEAYLVFAFGDSADKRVDTNLCSGTRLASQGPPTTTPCTTPTTSPPST